MQETEQTQAQSLGQDDPLEEEMATQLQYSCLENPMNRGPWWATVYLVTRVSHDLANKQPQLTLYCLLTSLPFFHQLLPLKHIILFGGNF